ncbi:hypothetical protein EDF78_101263 [Rahnella sp. BIGb0236]|uniref:hypothetical protein n=1 Tax=Rahnella sp. BIGb0236 TaxID=2485117 RepID=UPI0010EE08B2|nr:hypothetical protein [Rahnella sp. BIGb0236]TDS97888.1 hypothetical protein EDF78_101263 [Rahnella sp. BIGb0236]
MKYRIVFILIFISFFKTSWSEESLPEVDANAWKNDSRKIAQNLFDQEEKEQILEYKNTQNGLPDNQRKKIIPDNQYWLVNKKQELWLGIFDGKYVRTINQENTIAANEKLAPEKVIRIKQKNHTSQFLIDDNEASNILNCLNRRDGILSDEEDYMSFYTGCAYHKKSKPDELEIFYKIFFFSKTFNSIIKLDEFPDSALQGDGIDIFNKSIKKIKDYYVDTSIEAAFKFVGVDKIIVVNDKTGKPQPKTPKLDGNGNVVMTNGKPVLVDDPEGFQPIFLERLPEVIVGK